ncbi:MAG: PKD domain-containing protein [Chitinophagales bacterium]
MKTKFTLLLFVVLLQCQLTAIEAQISITAEDLPYPGLEVLTTVATLPPVTVGKASNQSQIWNYTKLDVNATQTVVFEEVSEDDLIASENFPNATMKSNLLSLFGGGSDVFPIDLGGATSYYSQNAKGNVLINGVHLNLGINIDSLGIDAINLVGNPADAFYTVGEYGDSFDHLGTYRYTFDVQLDTFPAPVPITVQINTDRHTEIDAFGEMQFRNTNYDVLRYNETTDVNLFIGVLLFGIPIFPIIDTSFQVPAYRFYTKDKGYPVASINLGEDETGSFVASVEYLAQAAPDPIGFSYEVNCLNVVFTNTSDETNGALLESLWDFGDGTTSNLKDVVHNYEEAGTYTVLLEITNANGQQLSLTKVVEVGCTDVEAFDLPMISHRVFPNPVREVLHFAFEADALNHIEQILVFNSLGQQTHAISSLSDVVQLDVSNWKEGVYFYALTSKNEGTIFGDRFVVQH